MLLRYIFWATVKGTHCTVEDSRVNQSLTSEGSYSTMGNATWTRSPVMPNKKWQAPTWVKWPVGSESKTALLLCGDRSQEGSHLSWKTPTRRGRRVLSYGPLQKQKHKKKKTKEENEWQRMKSPLMMGISACTVIISTSNIIKFYGIGFTQEHLPWVFPFFLKPTGPQSNIQRTCASSSKSLI